ncbi:hypothetical protein SAMN05444274_10694 [Mariniphaga anaerophila]|uniref:Uncharacterized protein n=1 Tax=Mariniphaga anaerophila TaxID=1484053 RepID=A0A1M5CEX8_9BACT|nr:hypothetical protein [Mariniphaga anaerophila]SHF53303.1 hypothetical protein SAMN05444274_10694 [Mariniphaga anaerophila]
MKNTILAAIVSFILIYILRKGVESAEKSGEKVDIFTAFQKGIKITIENFTKKEEPKTTVETDETEYEDWKPDNSDMANFTNSLCKFHGAKLKKQRGAFHLPTVYSHSN